MWGTHLKPWERGLLGGGTREGEGERERGGEGREGKLREGGVLGPRQGGGWVRVLLFNDHHHKMSARKNKKTGEDRYVGYRINICYKIWVLVIFLASTCDEVS